MIINIFKMKLPENPPVAAVGIIEKLKKSKNKNECLKDTYDFLSGKFRGYRIRSFTRPLGIFTNTVDNVWKDAKFLYCTELNYLMRILLVGSGWFKDEEILQKWTYIWRFFPHQYLKVKIADDRYVNVDLWGSAYGIKFGEYSRGFNTRLINILK